MNMIRNGWERLSSGFDVEFRNGVPCRLSDNGRGMTVTPTDLLDEIRNLGKLHVSLGDWERGENSDEHAAQLFVSAQDFAEVLRRLACSSAEVFVERFHKPVDASDVDWDRLEYLRDFHTALDHCGLQHGDMDRDGYRALYLDVMHRETRRIAGLQEQPLVEPED